VNVLGFRKAFALALAFTLIVLNGFTVMAEETEHEVDDLVVSASRVEENVKDTSATVNTLSQKELDDIKYRNPQEFLARIPGIFSHNFGGESELTSIRVPTHFTNPYTLVLIDGVPIAGYGSGSSSQFSEINPNTIQRIEVVKGPASALYGSNAIGGVINMITKNPTVNPTAGFSVEYGEEEQLRSSAYYSSTAGKLGYSFDVNYSDATGWRDNSAFEKQGANLKLDYAIGENADLAFKMDYMSKDGLTPGSIREAAFEENWQQSHHTFTYSKMDRITPTLAYNQSLGSGELSATLAYRDVEGESIPHYSIRKQGYNTYVGSKNINQENATNLQLIYHRYLDIANSRIIMGLDGETGTNEADTYGLSVDWDASANQYISYTENDLSKSFDIKTQVIAPYLQWELRPTDQLKFNIGGRYDSTNYEVADKLTDTDEESDFSRVTPKVGLIYDFSPCLNSFISYSEGFVVPTSSQLLTSSWSNKELDPEKAINYEIGIRTNFMENRMNFDLAVFHMDITDKIIAQETGPYTRQYANAGETSIRGAELTSIYKVNPWLSFAAAYTYAENRFEEYSTGSTDYSGNTPPRSPDHRFNLRIASTPMQNLRLQMERLVSMVSRTESDRQKIRFL